MANGNDIDKQLWLEVLNVRAEGVGEDPATASSQAPTPTQAQTQAPTETQALAQALTQALAQIQAQAQAPPQIKIEVQLKGDRGDKEPTWWTVKERAYGKDASEDSREIFRALDTKKTVLARIGWANGGLVVDRIRIQFNDAGSR